MMDRREFLRLTAAASGVGVLRPVRVLGARYQTSAGYFGVHPFVEAHREAVFVMRTDVDVKTNGPAIRQAGLTFARSIFVPMDAAGIPLTYTIPVKPNFTCSHSADPRFPWGSPPTSFTCGTSSALKTGRPGALTPWRNERGRA